MIQTNFVPLLVSGVGRSGTSIVLQALAEHHQVRATKFLGEAPFLSHFLSFARHMEADPYVAANYLVDAEARDRLFAAFTVAITGPDAERAGDDPPKPTFLQRLFPKPPAEPDTMFYPAKASLREPGTWDLFRRWFPDGRAVNVVRNGIEVVASSQKFHGFKDLPFRDLCERWRVHSVELAYLETDPAAAMIYHHELLADPARVLSQVFDALGMEPDDAPARLAREKWFNSSYSNNGTRPDFEGRAKREWDGWDADQRATFTEICEAEMERHGFSMP